MKTSDRDECTFFLAVGRDDGKERLALRLECNDGNLVVYVFHSQERVDAFIEDLRAAAAKVKWSK